MAVDIEVWNTPSWITPALGANAKASPKSRIHRNYASSVIRPVRSLSVLVLPQGLRIPECELELMHPLVAEAETSADGYVFRSGDLDEEAFGVTLEDALYDFLTSVADRYHSLARRKRLSPHDQIALDRLRSLLQPR